MQRDWKLIGMLWQGFVIMALAGILMVFFMQWGNTVPFIVRLFQTDAYKTSTLVLIGTSSGLIMALTALGLIKFARITLPGNEMTDILFRLVHVRGGLLTMSLGAGIAEEFLFRGVLVGLFLGFMPVGVLLPLNALLFMLVHIPQYKGRPLLHVFIFFHWLILSLLVLHNGLACRPNYCSFYVQLRDWLVNAKIFVNKSCAWSGHSFLSVILLQRYRKSTQLIQALIGGYSLAPRNLLRDHRLYSKKCISR